MSSNLCTPRMGLVAEEELERLRKIEATTAMLEAAKKEERKNALTRLHQQEKQNQEAVREIYMKQ